MYNYFVNGESRSYGYAQQQYRTLYETADESEWYRSHRGRVGYVVTESTPDANTSARSLFARLHDGFGSRQSPVDGLTHFRAVHASEGGEYKAFRLVPGATITGAGPANTTTTLSQSVEVSGASFTYERQVRTNAAGEYAVTVPYPGEYTIWNETISVSERNVTAGQRVG
jgi:dolichyl-diphosphooligosaccharide--protein glycosyltransferase